MTNFIPSTSTKRATTLLFISITALGISGCASQSYLYNAGKDQQGQIATKAASDAKLVDTVTAAEKRNTRLLDLELEAVKSRFNLIRDNEIRAVALSKDEEISVTWVQRMKDRQVKIWPEMTTEKYWGAIDKLLEETKRIRDKREELEKLVRPAPDCVAALQNEKLAPELTKNLSEDDKYVANKVYETFRVACKPLVEAQEALKATSGLLGGSSTQLKADEARLAEQDKAKKDAEEQLKIALTAYERVTKELNASSTGYADKLSAAAAELHKAVKKIEGAGNAVGIEVLAQNRLERIEEILTQLSEGKVDTSQWSEQLRSGVALVGTLPALADDTQKMLRETARPRVVPLLLAKEHQRLVVEEASQVNAVITRRIEASLQINNAYHGEYAALALVSLKLSQHKKWHSKTMRDLDRDLKPEERGELYEALGIYFDDVPRYQLAQHIWEYQRLATFYDESIEHSKYAALMWQNLNQGIAQPLAGYHGSGIKPETIAEFLKALGVILIGGALL